MHNYIRGIQIALNNVKRATSRRGGWRMNVKRNGSPEKNIPMQIKLLGSRRQAWRMKALLNLISTTFCDYGTDQDAWWSWYRRNKDRERADWACDALEDAGVEVLGLSLAEFIPACIEALRHVHKIVRAAAFYLLKHYTRRTAHFPVYATAGNREPHVREWRKWWSTRGIHRLGGNGGNGR
ncbi:MAG: hypothetical protein E3J72_03440 [Planctomycetota bacterium]|nr:MAG: hypothetical protein E3J72_03440 [Planctomycetota bacterium]